MRTTERTLSRTARMLLGACAVAMLIGPSVRSNAIASNRSSILQVAAEFPCSVAALLHVIRSRASSSEGVFYLDDVPSSDAIARIADRLDRDPDRPDAQLQRNPYSGQPFIVEVRWWAEDRSDGTVVLTFRAQWVARAGEAFQPPHLIEPTTVFVVSGSDIKFMALGTSAHAPI